MAHVFVVRLGTKSKGNCEMPVLAIVRGVEKLLVRKLPHMRWWSQTISYGCLEKIY